MPASGRRDLPLILLTWRIWWASNNASRWDLTLILLTWRIWWTSNSDTRWDLTLILLTWRIWWTSNSASRWDLTLILLTWRIWWPNNASRWQMGFKPFLSHCNVCHSPTLASWTGRVCCTLFREMLSRILWHKTSLDRIYRKKDQRLRTTFSVETKYADFFTLFCMRKDLFLSQNLVF